MTITATVNEKKEVTRELKLPYYAKSDPSVYRINADESITVASLFFSYASITHTTKQGMGYREDLHNILSMPTATADEFLAALESVRAKMEVATINQQ